MEKSEEALHSDCFVMLFTGFIWLAYAVTLVLVPCICGVVHFV